MNRSLKISLFSILFLLSFVVGAEEKILCTVTSDMDSDVAKMVYEMDQDQRAIIHLYQDLYRNGTRIERIEMNPSDLVNGGIVLSRRDKYVIVRMWSDNYDQERGGVFYLDTLYSGITGERRQYEMTLSMDKNGPVLSNQNQDFNQMKFIAKRSRVLGPIGVERIVFSR